MGLDLAQTVALDTFQAATGYPRRPGWGIALLGDSRMAQLFSDGGSGVFPAAATKVKTFHFVTVASAIGGGRLAVRGNWAVSGQRSDQYLSSLPSALASDAGLIAILGVVNDISQSGSTGDTAATIATRIIDAALATLRVGKTPLLFTDPASTAFSPSLIGMTMSYNQRIAEFAERTPGVLLFDLSSLIWDPTSATFSFRSGYSSDGVHYLAPAQFAAGVALADFLTPIISPYPDVSGTIGFVAANGNIGQIANPLMLTTTGGTAGAGITGSVPASYAASCSGSTTAVVSVAAAPDGRGNAVTLAITGAAAGDNIRVYQDTTLANYAVGDLIDLGARVVINSGADKLRQAALWGSVGGDANPIADLWNMSGTFGALPSGLATRTLTMRSVPYTIQTGASWVSWETRIVMAAAGAANVTIWAPMLRRRLQF